MLTDATALRIMVEIPAQFYHISLAGCVLEYLPQFTAAILNNGNQELHSAFCIVEMMQLITACTR
jgi:hypothetical protein